MSKEAVLMKVPSVKGGTKLDHGTLNQRVFGRGVFSTDSGRLPPESVDFASDAFQTGRCWIWVLK